MRTAKIVGGALAFLALPVVLLLWNLTLTARVAALERNQTEMIQIHNTTTGSINSLVRSVGSLNDATGSNTQSIIHATAILRHMNGLSPEGSLPPAADVGRKTKNAIVSVTGTAR